MLLRVLFFLINSVAKTGRQSTGRATTGRPICVQKRSQTDNVSRNKQRARPVPPAQSGRLAEVGVGKPR